MAQRMSLADRRKQEQELTGVKALIRSTEKNLPDAATSPESEPNNISSPETSNITEPDTPTATQPGTFNNTDTVTMTNAETATSTSTVFETYIKPSEVLVKKGYRITEIQAKFVEKMAKKYKVSESEIARIAFDYLMKNLK